MWPSQHISVVLVISNIYMYIYVHSCLKLSILIPTSTNEGSAGYTIRGDEGSAGYTIRGDGGSAGYTSRGDEGSAGYTTVFSLI